MKRSILMVILIFPAFTLLAEGGKRNPYNVGYDPITQGFYWGFEQAIHDYAIGLDIGTSIGLVMPFNVSLCLDNAYYFGKPDSYNLKTWHVNARVAYSKILVENKPNVLYLVPSIGKTFSLNEKLGLNVDLGYGFQLLHDWGESLEGAGINYYFGGISTPNLRVELKF